MKKIYVADFTLRKLSEERQNSFLFREKTAIASGIENFGADAIELDEIKKTKEDTIVYRTIASSLRNAKICIPVGTTKETLEAAWNCIKDAVSPSLQVVLPVSTVQMEYLYHIKEEKMLSLLSSLVSDAKEKCEDVEFIALDATRANTEFLIKACKTAEEFGATAVTISDDAGIMLPEEIAELVKTLKAECNISIYIKASNALNLAAATAIAAISAGADGVKTTISSEETLKADIFAQIVRTRGDRLEICTNLVNERIATNIKELTKKLSPLSYEQLEKSTDEKILLNSTSTLADICKSVQMLGYDLNDADLGTVLSETHKVCASKGVIGAKELEAIIASFAMQTPSTYHLESYMANSSDVTDSMARVTLTKDGEELTGVSTGNGPIDSAFRAIEQCIGHHYELDSFQIEAVTEGKEALGSALVKLRSGGRLYSGNGLSTDIISASVRAYINAVNKIVFEEK
jgi:2-isopropylmalate synthase